MDGNRPSTERGGFMDGGQILKVLSTKRAVSWTETGDRVLQGFLWMAGLFDEHHEIEYINFVLTHQ